MNNVVNPILRKVGKMCVAAVCTFALLSGVPAMAEHVDSAMSRPVIPQEFGQVIYQKHGDRPKQIFIIGQSHRSAATGANGTHTVRAQAEIYRIGEWLIHQENVRLLLPEGYFRREPQRSPVRLASGESPVMLQGAILDNETLHAKLADTSVFVNADILLRNNYNIRLQQVEDEGIYRGVREFMRVAQERRNALPAGFTRELHYLQEIRTAAMLQNIPAVIEEEFRQGMIPERRAMFTIGMAHLNETIQFLQDETIHVAAPPAGTASYDAYKDYTDILNLLEAGYGVTIILPRTLADDRETLRMVQLDTI
jgi:hypothetical protein